MAARKPLIGFYSGSFDPVTLGHLDIIERATGFVDELVIGIGVHHGKVPMFSVEERVAMLSMELKPIFGRRRKPIRIVTFDSLVVSAAKKHKAKIIVRGLRDGTDLDYEAQMAGMNKAMAGGAESVFLIAAPAVRHITATLVRQIAAMKGDVSPFVTAAVAEQLRQKTADRR